MSHSKYLGVLFIENNSICNNNNNNTHSKKKTQFYNLPCEESPYP